MALFFDSSFKLITTARLLDCERIWMVDYAFLDTQCGLVGRMINREKGTCHVITPSSRPP
jgi:hypothetical protein